MQSKNTYNQRKKFEDDFLKYKDLKREKIKVTIIFGSIMHRADITFSDGNNFRLTIHKIGDDLILSQPKLWDYTEQKLAVMNYLTDLAFFNESYTIIEDIELHKTNDVIKAYKAKGEIVSPTTYKYSIHPASFHEKDFIDYDVRVTNKVAKDFKFPVKNVG